MTEPNTNEETSPTGDLSAYYPPRDEMPEAPPESRPVPLPPHLRAWALPAVTAGVVAGFFGILVAMAGIMAWKSFVGPPPMALAIAASMLGMQAPAALAVLIVSRLALRHGDWAGITGLRMPHLRDIFAGLLWGVIAIGMSIVVGNAIDLVYTLLNKEMQSQDAVQMLMDGNTATMVALIVGAVFMAPVCEEIFFRLALYEAIRRWLPTGVAVVITSLLFGAVHMSLAMLVPLVLLGVLLQISRLKHQSIYVPIIAHMVFNSMTVVVIIAQRYMGGTL